MAQVDLDRIRDVAEIGHDADLDPVCSKAKAHGIGRVMRDREAIHFDIADRKRRAGLEAFERGLKLLPIDGRRGEPRDVDRLVAFLRQRDQSRDVVRMLVRDQDAVEVVLALADRAEPRADLFPAQPGVDEEARAFSGNEGGIAGAAAGQNADLDDESS